jgi:hypothetical protein
MEGGSSKKEQPAGIKREGKRWKWTSVDIDKQHLDSLKEIDKRMKKTSSDSDNVSTQSPSCNETAVTIGQFGFQGIGTTNTLMKTEMSCSSRSKAGNVSKHVNSFPSIIWVQWQQPYKPCGLQFCFWRLSKKCHWSSNCCSTEWIINVQHILRAFCALCWLFLLLCFQSYKACRSKKKNQKIILFCFCISSMSLFQK